MGAVGLVLGVAGCTATPAPTPTPSASATKQPTPTPTVTLSPAQEREADFEEVVLAVWATDARFQGRAYIDALVAEGFDRGAMQLTPDETSIGLQADSVLFAVRLDEECLVGQVGPAIGDPVVAILPALATGGCLVGQTRPIDW